MPSLDKAAPATIHIAGLLVTKDFKVTIIDNHEEGEVEYDGVLYHGVSRKTGKSVDLTGSTYQLHDAHGTPTQWLGYKFKKGNVEYDVLSERGNQWRLQMTRGRNTVLVDEIGVWHDLPGR